ncbi:MAG TPA: hypothetical protein PKN13_13855 [Accumulibacter sp.]|nr:hypothetical protein [Accumulibacter sp.]HMW16864.1 hypothetical protein [Accumulibacter sp.]HMX21591.1 hypothetical protein [Accumulibacter sp.]HNC17537.1 hypothetical protein [Accumulibacter sp.]HND81066.1 hypothetical protein [Accumulibacter sp.]
MSSLASSQHAAAIIAAAHELKRRRLAAGIKLAPPQWPKSEKKKDKSKKIRLQLRLPASEYRRIGELKCELAESGFKVKKRDLIRASLLLLVNLDRAEIKVAMRKVIAPESSEAPEPVTEAPDQTPR